MSSIRTPKAIRYDLHIDELGKTISYRALKVGEQKALLTAMGMKDAQAIVNSIVDIITECTFNEHDVSKWPMHIVDYVFLNIYAKSAGSITQAEYSCGGTIEEEVEVEDPETGEKTKELHTAPCGAKMRMNIDLSKAIIKYPDGYSPAKVIDLGDGMVVKMRFPSFEAFKKIDPEKEWIDIADQFIFSGIECIQDGDDVKVPGVDFSFEELVDWLNNLDSTIMQQVNDFFQESPALSLTVPVTCPKCGKKEVFELSTLEDFFT